MENRNNRYRIKYYRHGECSKDAKEVIIEGNNYNDAYMRFHLAYGSCYAYGIEKVEEEV